MILAIDFSGENEFSGDIELICCRIVASEAGWKIFWSLSLVMRSVFEGGAGEIRPGIEDKSNDKGDLDRFADNEPGEDAPETGGEACRPSVCRGGSCVATDISVDSILFVVAVDCCPCGCGGLVSWSRGVCWLDIIYAQVKVGDCKKTGLSSRNLRQKQ